MTEYNRHPLVNPIPTVVLAIFLGIIFVEAFLFFGFDDPMANSGAAAERMLLTQKYGVSPKLANWMFETGNFSVDYVSRL